MSPREDRRRISVRLSVLQYTVVVLFTALAVSFWVLQVVQHAEVRGNGREQPSADARPARAARHRVRSRHAGAGREPSLVQHLDRARAHEGSESHDPPARAGAERTGSARSRDRRSPPARADLPADHDRAGCDAGAGRGGHRAPAGFRAARRDGRGSAHAPVSQRLDGGASVRLCRRGKRHAGGGRRPI